MISAALKVVLVMLVLVSCRVISAGSVREDANVVSVKKFGAEGNGAADDTAAIQNSMAVYSLYDTYQ